MCGIIGVSGKSIEGDSFVQATRTLQNRGPDKINYFVDSDLGVALGHTRLRIIDLKSRSDQPMMSSCGRYQIVFNGEIYNFKELIEKYSLSCKTGSDTEVLLELFALKGPKFIEECNGMFAFVIWDRIENCCYLFRDRIGIKPLYYGVLSKTLFFASELKALKLLLAEDLEIDNHSIRLFLQLGYIPKPYTCFKNIMKFPQGSYGLFKGGNLEISSFWEVDKSPEMVTSNFTDAKDQLRKLIHSSVQYRLIADVDVGAFLSGGIDSSMVSAVAAKYSSKRLKTFSIGIKDSKIDETGYAKKIAKHLDTDHSEYLFSEEDLIENFEEIIENFDEPFADSSCFPTSLLSCVTRKEATVALSGDGGDELFMGYNSYQWAARLSNPVLYLFRNLIAGGLHATGSSRNRRVAELMRIPSRELFYQHIFSQEQYFFSTSELSELLISGTGSDKAIFSSDLTNASGKQSYFDLQYYLPDDLLTKVDRTSMMHSLEVRVPLLDHRIVEFANSLPAEYKMNKGVAKYILKEILYEEVPKQYFDRPKWGFGIPLGKWLKKDLSFLIDKYLSRSHIENFSVFDADVVESYVKRFHNGEDYLYNRIWALILIQRFMTKINDQHHNTML